MPYLVFIIFSLLSGCVGNMPTSINFQECTVGLVSELKYRPALGLLSKSCYMKYGNHELGNEARTTGSCIIDKIANIISVNDGKKLIDSCSKSNIQLNIFLNDALDDN